MVKNVSDCYPVGVTEDDLYYYRESVGVQGLFPPHHHGVIFGIAFLISIFNELVGFGQVW